MKNYLWVDGAVFSTPNERMISAKQISFPSAISFYYFNIFLTGLIILAGALFVGCATRPGEMVKRHGDEMVVAGKFIHTGTPIVLWMDPGGYDAYRVERRFSPFAESDWATSTEKVKDLKSPNRYGLRKDSLSEEQIERVRGGGWDLS
ncbi:MAG: hypothetical protein ACR2H1_03350, partial [Limisphaerales bacterium]